jgi:manganese transport system ATP-binding protein
MRKVLMHGPPEVVLQPEHLAMAFGLDVLNRELPDDGTPDVGTPAVGVPGAGVPVPGVPNRPGRA